MPENNAKKVEFRPPEAFHAPEGTEAGKKFDLVCTFEVSPDGMLCMTKLGDAEMPGYDGEEKNETEADHRPDYSNYSKGLMEGMGEGGAPSPESY